MVFTKKIQPFNNLKLNKRSDAKFKIVFNSEEVENAYYTLLDHNCTKCNGKSFKTFADLKDHMRRVHQLNYCDLCVNNLKVSGHLGFEKN